MSARRWIPLVGALLLAGLAHLCDQLDHPPAPCGSDAECAAVHPFPTTDHARSTP